MNLSDPYDVYFSYESVHGIDTYKEHGQSMKWYIAGPMSGIPQFNIPAFDKAAETLRSQGYDIVSPAERDTYETRKGALASKTGDHVDLSVAESYGDMLARDMKIIADEVDGIIFLPGWKQSRGARTEAYLALTFGRSFALYRPVGILGISNDVVKQLLIEAIRVL